MDRVVRSACVAAAALALAPLVAVVAYVVMRGMPAVSLALLSELPGPVGEGSGGLAHAIEGSALLVAGACLIAFPCGILTGIYLGEVGRGRLPGALRYVIDVLAGVPSIVIGLLVYVVVVVPMRTFSVLAGSIALALVMLPTITRTTEEMTRLVPSTLREAGLALGVARWRITLRVVVRTAVPGIVTGGLLAVARAAGETAPLLFTALGSQDWASGLRAPIASLPVQIYTYAVSPYEAWHRQAWAAALLLLLFVLAANVVARVLSRPRGARR